MAGERFLHIANAVHRRSAAATGTGESKPEREGHHGSL
jgi:hypothetical protein